MTTELEYKTEPGRIYIEKDGELLGEVTFREAKPNLYTIRHTFVHEKLRGQGVADELVRRAVEELESRGASIRATCSYAVEWLKRYR